MLSHQESSMNKTLLTLCLSSLLLASSIEVHVTKVEEKSQLLTLQADGVVLAKTKKSITSKASGIVKLFIHNNSTVTTGEKIAQIIDTRRLEKLKLFVTKLSLVKNELKSQKSKLIDAQEMFKMGVGSKNNYLNEQLLNEQLKENLQTLQSEYRTLQKEQKDSIIYATQNGTITQLIPSNTYVNYGTTIATFIDKENLVKLFVDASYKDKIHQGMLVTIKNPFKDTHATISYVLPTSTNNLIEVIARPKSYLPRNLRVDAQIELESIKGVSLPKSALVLVENHPAVYLIENGVAHVKYVDVIQDMLDYVLLKNTFKDQSLIATTNTYMLHDNLKVKIK